MVQIRTEIGSDNPHTVGDSETYAKELDVDVLIVGAGFGGVYLLYKLRELGFKCKIYEAGKDLGGIWHWNCYPGARVDSAVPVYEYSIEKVWRDWTWSEKFPGFAELRRYFEHVDAVLDIKKDVAFETTVVSGQFDKPLGKWIINTEDGRMCRAKYFIPAIGFAAKRYLPDWKGIDAFRGVIHHSSFWPEEEVNFKNKRVAVIGTGATGIQITQETSKEAESVTVFMRTPNIALPMRQAKLNKEEQNKNKPGYPEFFKYRLTTFSGSQFDFLEKNAFDDPPEEREREYEKIWAAGGFRFWVAGYKDVFSDPKSNRDAYNFWAKKTRARISNPRKRDLLAPLEPPHPFGVKRPSLEQDYYEQLDRSENELVDVNATPISEITETGIKTSDGTHREFDIIAIATGFDAVTGGFKDMGLKDVDGVPLTERWKDGTWTYLGMSCSGFPNMFFLYGAHGPTAFSNGPSCIEAQGDWIVDVIKLMKDNNMQYIEATREAEVKWSQNVQDISNTMLFSHAKSWYMGANIPGKPLEQLNYAGGIPDYMRGCRESLDKGLLGFVTA